MALPHPEFAMAVSQNSPRLDRTPQAGHPNQATSASPSMASESPLIAVVGPVVRDLRVIVLPGQPKRGKLLSRFRTEWGGAVRNVSRAIADYGGRPRPSFQLGCDHASDAAMEALGDEFSTAQFDRCYGDLRESVILPDGLTFTSRPSLQRDHIHEPLRALISTTTWTVIAPLAADDFAFVEDGLRVAPRSLLMLSRQQAAAPSRALRLMLAADVTVLNHEEAEVLSGCSDPHFMVVKLRDLGCQGVVITTPMGAEAYLGGELYSVPALDVGPTRQTSGAEDCCTGVMVTAWAAGLSWRAGLELGQAAAARHVAQLAALRSLEVLRDWAELQPQVTALDHTALPAARTLTFPRRHVVAAAVGAGLASFLLLGLLV
ncbi:MAG: carbohydrate kinase family protein [Pirellulaceae bacterium]